jgi:two-component system response regulator HupR/HoxA
MLFEAAVTHSKTVRGLTEDAMRFLAAYDWPGNLPELRNEVTRMLVYAQEPVLGSELISRHILQAQPGGSDPGEDAVLSGTGPLKDRVEAIEKRILREALTRLKWNKSRAAQELGLSRVGLRAKLDRYGLSPGRDRNPRGELSRCATRSPQKWSK